MEKTTISIAEMKCGGCVETVENALKQLPGVQEVRVFLQPGEAEVTYDAQRLSRNNLLEAVKRAGYQPFVSEDRIGSNLEGD